MQARRLEPSDLRRMAPALMSPKVCAAGKYQEYVPQPKHIPVALQRLRPRVLAALRPLDVDAGVYQRAPHGYRVHTAMICFSWASTSVDDKIQALPKKKDKHRATKALQHLLTCTDSAYKTFYDLHLNFLRKHGTNVEEKLRKSPLSLLETPCLNALSGLNSIGITTSVGLSREPTMKIAGNDDEPHGSRKPRQHLQQQCQQ